MEVHKIHVPNHQPVIFCWDQTMVFGDCPILWLPNESKWVMEDIGSDEALSLQGPDPPPMWLQTWYTHTYIYTCLYIIHVHVYVCVCFWYIHIHIVIYRNRLVGFHAASASKPRAFGSWELLKEALNFGLAKAKKVSSICSQVLQLGTTGDPTFFLLHSKAKGLQQSYPAW